jgi:hypothetical protein
MRQAPTGRAAIAQGAALGRRRTTKQQSPNGARPGAANQKSPNGARCHSPGREPWGANRPSTKKAPTGRANLEAPWSRQPKEPQRGALS